MHLRQVEIVNIRSIERLKWSIPKANAPGWHVVVGGNGSGKTSFLRSIALALLGPLNAFALRQSWGEWLRQGEPEGTIRLKVDWDEDFDRISPLQKPAKGPLAVELSLSRWEGESGNEVELTPPKEGHEPASILWKSVQGWFFASYGPYRRLSGGDPEFEAISRSMTKLGRNISLFDERVALTDFLQWLHDLRFKELEKDPEGDLLPRLKIFINQEGFLPFNTRLKEVTSKGVFLVDGNGFAVRIDQLSDGYRSLLALTFELIRHFATAFGPDQLFAPGSTNEIVCPGVVLIDEIDVHLHPTWQQHVGLWFRKHFPRTQFIVTSHSPLVCRAADVGSVYLLPDPGRGDSGRMIEGVELKRLIYGNVLEAYGTEVFGARIASSDQSLQMREQLARLNRVVIVVLATVRRRPGPPLRPVWGVWRRVAAVRASVARANRRRLVAFARRTVLLPSSRLAA